MVGNRIVYWVAQFAGWMLYAVLLVIFNILSGKEVNPVLLQTIVCFPLVGMVVTHLYRYFILRFKWLNLSIQWAILVILTSSVAMGLVMHIMVIGVFSAFSLDDYQVITQKEHIDYIVNYVFLMFLWSVLYFTTHYFANYKKAEIKNLKMLASQNEIELINLKSQLNPHFMFNALNSIRALIDEDPTIAKTAITQLSAMLRGSLQTGKRQLITLDEELSLVKSYLAIEKIRFEERLKVSYDIDHDTLNYNIPPLMIQTLVENAVKHGISSLTKGGELTVSTELNNGQLLISVRNSGKYKPGKSTSTGIGLVNTERRLGLLYGDEAQITINNENQEVISTILIPKNLIYENIDN